MFISYFLKFVDIGVQAYHDPRERRRIEVINVFNALCATIGVSYAVSFTIESEHYYSSLILSFVAISFSLISFLQWKNEHKLARLLLNLNCGVSATLMSYLHGWDSGFPLCFLASPMMIVTFQDIRNKSVAFLLVIYYLTMVSVAYLLHYFHLEYLCEHKETMFPVNFISVFVLNGVLAYYLWKIYDDYGQQVDSKNMELSIKNDALEQTNDKIKDLVSLLHDKVKNNLQTLLLFSEMDNLAKLNLNSNDHIRLSTTRVKVMDFCYCLEFEQSVAQTEYFQRFMVDYTFYLKTAYCDKLEKNLAGDLLIGDADKVMLPRKRFDAIMLLINELWFYILTPLSQKLNKSIDIKGKKGKEKKYIISISIADYPFTPIFSDIFLRFVRTQQVDLKTEYDETSRKLAINLKFDVDV